MKTIAKFDHGALIPKMKTPSFNCIRISVKAILLALAVSLISYACSTPRANRSLEASFSNKNFKISEETQLKYNETTTLFIEQVNAYKELEKKGLIRSNDLRESIQAKLFQVENFKKEIDKDKQELDETALNKYISLAQEAVESIRIATSQLSDNYQTIGNLEYSLELNKAIDFPGYSLAYWIVVLVNNSNKLITDVVGKIGLDAWNKKIAKYHVYADAGVRVEALYTPPKRELKMEKGKIVSESVDENLGIKIDNLNPHEKVVVHLLLDSDLLIIDDKDVFKKLYFRSKGLTAIEKQTKD